MLVKQISLSLTHTHAIYIYICVYNPRACVDVCNVYDIRRLYSTGVIKYTVIKMIDVITALLQQHRFTFLIFIDERETVTVSVCHSLCVCE